MFHLNQLSQQIWTSFEFEVKEFILHSIWFLFVFECEETVAISVVSFQQAALVDHSLPLRLDEQGLSWARSCAWRSASTRSSPRLASSTTITWARCWAATKTDLNTTWARRSSRSVSAVRPSFWSARRVLPITACPRFLHSKLTMTRRPFSLTTQTRPSTLGESTTTSGRCRSSTVHKAKSNQFEHTTRLLIVH